MDVLITFGRYAGQIRDIEPEAALAMLKDGRAKRPGEAIGDAAEVSVPIAATTPEVKLPQQRAKGRARR